MTNRPSGCPPPSGRRRSRGSRSRPGGARDSARTPSGGRASGREPPRRGHRGARGRAPSRRLDPPAHHGHHRPGRAGHLGGREATRRSCGPLLPSLGGQRRDGVSERPTAGGVVHEHVEAGGRGAEEHGRRRRRPPPQGARGRSHRPAGPRRRASRPAPSGPGRPPGRATRARARSRRSAPRRRRARQRPGRGRTGRHPCPGHRRSARSAARTLGARPSTASGWVPWESLTNRTPSTIATDSRRCSTPSNAVAARRIASGATPNRRPVATAARALETLWRPGIASSATGRTRPCPSPTIQPSTTPTPPAGGCPCR